MYSVIGCLCLHHIFLIEFGLRIYIENQIFFHLISTFLSDSKHAVYIEPLSCGIHAANRANIQLNDVVVISGAGAVGLGATCAAKRKSPKYIVVLDLDDDKLKVAKQCGADEIWNPSRMDVVKSVMEITDFYGAFPTIVTFQLFLSQMMH